MKTNHLINKIINGEDISEVIDKLCKNTTNKYLVEISQKGKEEYIKQRLTYFNNIKFNGVMDNGEYVSDHNDTDDRIIDEFVQNIDINSFNANVSDLSFEILNISPNTKRKFKIIFANFINEIRNLFNNDNTELLHTFLNKHGKKLAEIEWEENNE